MCRVPALPFDFKPGYCQLDDFRVGTDVFELSEDLGISKIIQGKFRADSIEIAIPALRAFDADKMGLGHGRETIVVGGLSGQETGFFRRIREEGAFDKTGRLFKLKGKIKIVLLTSCWNFNRFSALRLKQPKGETCWRPTESFEVGQRVKRKLQVEPLLNCSWLTQTGLVVIDNMVFLRVEACWLQAIPSDSQRKAAKPKSKGLF